jgi:hypothetical protein
MKKTITLGLILFTLFTKAQENKNASNTNAPTTYYKNYTGEATIAQKELIEMVKKINEVEKKRVSISSFDPHRNSYYD